MMRESGKDSQTSRQLKSLLKIAKMLKGLFYHRFYCQNSKVMEMCS